MSGSESRSWRNNNDESGQSPYRWTSNSFSSSSRGGHNTQQSNSFNGSRNRQYIPNASRDASGDASTRGSPYRGSYNGRGSPYRGTYNRRGSSHRGGYNGREQLGVQHFDPFGLEKLSQMSSDDLVTSLIKHKTQFEQLLNGKFTPDLMVATVRVLANLCRGNFIDSVTRILTRACSNTFLESVENFLTTLPFEKESAAKQRNKLYWENRNRFWQNLEEVFQKMIDLIPSKARDELTGVLDKTNVVIANIEINQDYAIGRNIKESLSKMSDTLQQQLNKFEAQSAIREIKPKVLEKEPPESFRHLSVVPTEEDLFDSNPFIRANRTTEPYDSVEHYLDVQFRLLREDFIGPLRDGIDEYLSGPSQRRNKNVGIYKRVRFQPQDQTKRHSDHTVFFGVKQIDWNDCKRLMFGSLLCLSRDNFNTILFATIVARDVKDLAQGILHIRLCGQNLMIPQDFYDHDFVMLESKLYFEPYFVVLNALRHMYEMNFPMKTYLIDADTSVKRPRYLENETIKLTYDRFKLPVDVNDVWPSPEELKLDGMQYQAFKCALTEEFSVIQGPPGTGKTFLALQIIRTMLLNSEHWDSSGPIIILCLTNHALDQFLEGILNFTTSIVRIGSRSKNPVLSDLNIKNLRQSSSRSRSFGGKVADANYDLHDAYRNLNGHLQNIAETEDQIRSLTQENALVPFWYLKKYCNDPILDDLDINEPLLNWLLGYNFLTLESPLLKKFSDRLFSMRHNVMFPLKHIDEMISLIQAKIISYTEKFLGAYELPFDPTMEWQYDIYELRNLRSSLKQNLDHHPLVQRGNRTCRKEPRWEKYWQWVTICHAAAVRILPALHLETDQLTIEVDEAKEKVDLEIMRESKVVGLTTTAAARLHSSVRALKAPIVLVEEAAEILEAHVVCSLSKNCQHIILIGDHKQLRPKASVYQLGTKYNLNISLFERMVNIRGNCTQLVIQHRMRPEIANLIRPSIYETLHDHESVHTYASVKGLSKNVFFLHHTNPEITSDVNEDSWSNPHEAQFLVAFARHLTLQGYKVSEITVLCTYGGQLFTLMKEKDRYPILRDLRATTLDNYQGEENRLILLSLVRNNEEGNIGFLREENRVCVALSRAREGLYVMGNMDNLTANDNIWSRIKQVLVADYAIGDSLELRCHNHPEEITMAEKAEDFENCPEGGCLKNCNAKLLCGHVCRFKCHILDQVHEDYRCKKPCLKTCLRGHPCPLSCCEGCKSCLIIEDRELRCGHTVLVPCWAESDTYPCPVVVETILPDCKHKIEKPCHKPVEKIRCPHPCEIRLPCGHTCTFTCHVNIDPDHLLYKCEKECTENNLDCTMNHPCEKQCGEKCTPCAIDLKKERSCGHHFDCKCSQDVEKIVCVKPCKRQMDCGHRCQLTCNKDCGKCQVKVKKTSFCGHEIIVKCSEEATPSKCGGPCQRMLPCGHSCTLRCKNPCTTTCGNMTQQTKPGLCGHQFAVPCYIQDCGDPHKLLRYCREPCNTELACGHICKGNCGTCKQGRIHIPCAENCGNVLICGHRCEVPCRQECPPCKKRCEVKCRHNKCNRKCGEPCVPCKEKCGWSCPHSKCSKRCSELCDRDPCNEPCPKILPCGHKCIGFCGEPCPKLCRICQKEELLSEFILDCGHCIESHGLMQWISQCSESIQMKSCPRCKTLISKCRRIMNQIKTDVKDVQLIKKKIFGDQVQLQKEQQLLLKEIELMVCNPVLKNQNIVSSDLKNFMDCLKSKVRPVIQRKQRQILDVRAIEATKITINILQQMFQELKNIDHTVKIYPWLEDQISMLVQSLSLTVRGQISNQEINDIEPELRRLHYMAEICKMNPETIFGSNESLKHEVAFIGLVEKATSVEKFSESRELDMKNEIGKLAPVIGMVNDRKMIVKAMGFKQGHWFKCPNGHYYSIGECGGAMQESKCFECGAAIGGSQHRLTSGNTFAPEIDGATEPAWPGTMH